MPVEIRELVIRTVVTDKRDDESDADSPFSQPAQSESDLIIQECVRQVLRILRKEKER